MINPRVLPFSPLSAPLDALPKFRRPPRKKQNKKGKKQNGVWSERGSCMKLTAFKYSQEGRVTPGSPQQHLALMRKKSQQFNPIMRHRSRFELHPADPQAGTLAHFYARLLPSICCAFHSGIIRNPPLRDNINTTAFNRFFFLALLSFKQNWFAD